MSDITTQDLRASLARRSLLDFSARVNPRFESPAHIAFLTGILERIEQGHLQRVAIAAPPGHGKSSLLNAFAAYAVGRDPSRRILMISASEALAKRNSRDAQSLVTGDGWPFEDIALSANSLLEWHLHPGAGSVRAIGKGGVVTGFRAELAIVDDLQADAGSDTTRKSDFEWFRGVLSTRLEPTAACIVIQARWHDDDIVGQLQAVEGGEWLFINLPALCVDEKSDPIGRAAGDALWPSRWPVKKIESVRAEVGPNIFAALYQGDPVPASGSMFAPEWFEHRYTALPRLSFARQPTEEERILQDLGVHSAPYRKPILVIQACDSAWKTGLTNDRSVIATLATDYRDVFLTDLWFGRLLYPDLRRVMLELYNKHQPSRVYVEAAASGFALVDDLKRSTPIPIIGIPPGRESKAVRAEATTRWFESGRIQFPSSASWMQDLLGEFLRFPHGRHDDIVDAVVLGVRQLQLLMSRARQDNLRIDDLNVFGR